jgi:hypothetical protein
MLDLLQKYNKSENLNILIGIPAYGGIVQTGFTQSLIDLVSCFVTNNIRHYVYWITGESLIPRARNSILAKFHNDKDFTHLFFIDTDITFKIETVINLIISSLELSGVSYPKKNINWNRTKHLIKNNVSDLELYNSMSDMNYNLRYHKNDKGVYLNKIGGFIESKDVPTGFMMIKRIVVDLLVLNYPEFEYTNNVSGYGNEYKFYDFFKCGVVDNIYLSEDYYFCYLCREIGIQLFLDCESTLVHTGKMDFYGCLKNFIYGDKYNSDIECLKGVKKQN